MAKFYFEVKPEVLSDVLSKLQIRFSRRAVRFKRRMRDVYKTLRQYSDSQAEVIVLPGNLFMKALGYIGYKVDSTEIKRLKLQKAA